MWVIPEDKKRKRERESSCLWYSNHIFHGNLWLSEKKILKSRQCKRQRTKKDLIDSRDFHFVVNSCHSCHSSRPFHTDIATSTWFGSCVIFWVRFFIEKKSREWHESSFYTWMFWHYIFCFCILLVLHKKLCPTHASIPSFTPYTLWVQISSLIQ